MVERGLDIRRQSPYERNPLPKGFFIFARERDFKGDAALAVLRPDDHAKCLHGLNAEHQFFTHFRETGTTQPRAGR